MFVTTSPLSPPYPMLFCKAFATPLADDDTTEYTAYMGFDRATNTAVIWVPGVLAPTVVTDPLISSYWGSRVCVQERRIDTTDGRVSWTGIGSSVVSPTDSGVAASLYLPGSQTMFLIDPPRVRREQAARDVLGRADRRVEQRLDHQRHRGDLEHHRLAQVVPCRCAL